MSWARSGAALAGALVVATAGVAGCGDADGGERQWSKPERAIDVELGVTAKRAQWRPGGGPNAGTLVLEGVSPETTVMAIAPERRATTIPTRDLRSTWHRFFAADGDATNVLVSARVNGRRTLVPVRARLLAGRGLRLALRPLPGARHGRLPAVAATVRDLVLVVDPPIGEEEFALWESLAKYFPAGNYRVPPNPFFLTDGGQRLVYEPGGVYPDEVSESHIPMDAFFTPLWRRVQEDIFRRSGTVGASEDGLTYSFEADSYRNLAFLPGPKSFDYIRFGDFGGQPKPVRVESSAIYGVKVDVLAFSDARVAGLNMRGTEVADLHFRNTLFQGVDLTGARFVRNVSLSSIYRSVFVNVSGNRTALGADGKPDPYNDKPVRFHDITVLESAFRDCSFPGARLSGTKLMRSALMNVDFSGAQIVGHDPTETSELDRTFGGSVLDRVRFDRAWLHNASFRDADLSKVSFDGATLDNVDFTDAKGLQHVDWSKVKVVGPVYGLGDHALRLNLSPEDRLKFVRSMTFAGRIPKIDSGSGLDIDPRTTLLVTPDGIRLKRGFFGGLTPVDSDGRRLLNPVGGRKLEWSRPLGLHDPKSGEAFEVELRTGRLRRP